jgi:NAD(P)-dependent dehydrogenase (short-subunit alcohol dehydrogenase family)
VEVVVITGASAGLGRAIAREFAKRGARIGLLARDRARLETALSEVQALGGDAVVCVCDVADAQQVEHAAEDVEAAFGPIDIWINNAMVSVFSPVKDMTADEFRRVTEVTYLGTVHGTLAALKRMLPRDRGVIVQVGSALAFRSIPLQSAYCAAKHAVNGFTESLLCELLHDNSRVHVTEVHMPALNTPQFSWVRSRLPNKPQPVPPIFQPEVGARAVYWAAHRKRREVLVGVPTVKAIVADKFVPGIADRRLARMGYAAQQTSEPVPANRSDNLFQTVSGDFAAHGEFDASAKSHSLQFAAVRHRSLLVAAAIGLTAATLWLTQNTRNRTPPGIESAA